MNAGARHVARHQESKETIRGGKLRCERTQRRSRNRFEQGVERFIEQRRRHSRSRSNTRDGLAAWREVPPAPIFSVIAKRRRDAVRSAARSSAHARDRLPGCNCSGNKYGKVRITLSG